ncbi:MAG: hypothetical protein JWM10_1576 [Myxococcaceae bacterium]|nr:hypothetical protein [Myxococcaceae bacterium]
MRAHLLTLFVALLSACASTVGPIDAGEADVDAAPANDRPTDDATSDNGSLLCSAPFRDCDRDAAFLPCQGGCGACVSQVDHDLEGTVHRTAPVCGNYTGGQCVPGLNPRNCLTGGENYTCLTYYVPNDRVNFPTGFARYYGLCLGGDTCLEVLRRESTAYPPSLRGRDHCWYTDRTTAVSGRPGPAECITQPFHTCGVGCAACPDQFVCLWNSERQPTGICLPVETFTPPNLFTTTGCWTNLTPGRACRQGDSCLKPVRGGADGVPDAERIGFCVPDDQCTAVAGRLPDGYRCDNSPPASR